MKKKLIITALVLLVAMGGVFAASIDGATVTATLTASLGEVFEHGFVHNQMKYQPTTSVDDAFETDPVFTYGFRTNTTSNLQARMTISNFIKDDESGNDVGIKSVKIGSGPGEKVSGQDYYLILTHSGSDLGVTEKSVNITVTPDDGDYDDAGAGDFTSTVTVVIATV